ncbi:MAG: serine protease [Pseudomonadota bacterium]|nr:serine protease [Pseudomonadota bacterium]
MPDNIVIHFHKEGPQLGEWIPIMLPLYRSDGTPYWIEHPRLGSAADVVAMNVNWGADVRKLPYYMKTDHDRANIIVGPAETVSVIGFPFGLSSSGKYPVWATGFLAQELSLVTPDDPSFLVDCRTRPGQSGSAVIAYRAGTYRTRKEHRVQSKLSPTPIWEFLGIYGSRVNRDSDLGKVWHVSAVEEVLDAAAADMAKRIGQSSRK